MDRTQSTSKDKLEGTLVVIDVQQDFCDGGALAVPKGSEVVGVINSCMGLFDHVLLTQDWHPFDHLSFASRYPDKSPYDTVTVSYGDQVLWPDHCVQGTKGAAFHPDFDVTHAELIIRKGFRREIDSYSAFFENDRKTPTGLSGYLRERGISRLYLTGLATDFCVLYSALDAVQLGFSVQVIEDACRGMDLNGSLASAWNSMEEAGVGRICSTDLLSS